MRSIYEVKTMFVNRSDEIVHTQMKTVSFIDPHILFTLLTFTILFTMQLPVTITLGFQA